MSLFTDPRQQRRPPTRIVGRRPPPPRRQKLAREEKLIFGLFGAWAIVAVVWTLAILTAVVLGCIWLANHI